jgi:hypothetical protein
MFRAVLLISSVLLLSLPVWSSSRQERARELIDRAIRISDIRASGSTPFQASGRVTLFDVGSSVMHGRFHVIWISPDRSKQDLHFAGYEQSRVIGEKKYWIKRSLPYEPLPMMRAEHALFVPQFKLWPGERVSRIEKVLEHGTAQECLDLRTGESELRRLCFDVSSGVAVRYVHANESAEYLEYKSFGEKLVPRLIRYYENGKLQLETEMQNLAAVLQAETVAVQPAPNSEEWDRCENMSTARSLLSPQPDREGLAYRYLPVGASATVAKWSS